MFHLNLKRVLAHARTTGRTSESSPFKHVRSLKMTAGGMNKILSVNAKENGRFKRIT